MSLRDAAIRAGSLLQAHNERYVNHCVWCGSPDLLKIHSAECVLLRLHVALHSGDEDIAVVARDAALLMEYKGIDLRCLWCGGESEYEDLTEGGHRRTLTHKDDCAYVNLLKALPLPF